MKITEIDQQRTQLTKKITQMVRGDIFRTYWGLYLYINDRTIMPLENLTDHPYNVQTFDSTLDFKVYKEVELIVQPRYF